MSEHPIRNFFDLFGLPVRYGVDRDVLDRRYRDLQRAAHPDRFASATEQARRISMQQAADVNEGYRVLRDPLARARYLLELRGYRFRDEHHTTDDADFLMEQMELREALEQIPEAADPLAAVAAFSRQIEARSNELADSLGDSLDAAEADVERAVEQVMKLQFYRKLQDQAAALEADLEDEHL